MKTRIAILFLGISILIISCEKETFPDNEDLIGAWVEIADEHWLANQVLVFDDDDTLFYTRPFSGLMPVSTDTFLFRLDKEQERLFLTPVTPPGASESSHKMLLDKKTNELTVWGLIVSIPENETKFEKQ